MKLKKTTHDQIQEFLSEVPEGEWKVLQLTIKKKGDNLQIVTGESFGPFIFSPPIDPDN